LIEHEDFDERIIEQVKELVGAEREGIEVAYHGGSPFWWNEHVQNLSTEQKSESLTFEDWGRRRFRSLPKSRPSDKMVDSVTVDDLIEVNFGKGRELGTEVHELFEKIEWWKKEVTIAQWLEKNALQYSVKSKEVFSRAMSNHDIENLFLLPMNRSEVWLERSFVLEDEGAMIQGIFDRVILHYSETGDLDRAEIIDFKTDRLSSGGDEEELVNRHRNQLESYRVALHRLTGIPIAKIKMILLFTSIPNIFNWS
jgi:ATP-dependent exoDNAse (exonuclease V) beta subunit